MPTKQRERSESGFYHVFQRGVNRACIFEDDEDRDRYLALLLKYAKLVGAEIHSWCLMSNHVHLLVRVDYEALSVMMRRIGSEYARRFNVRHGRSGPLFGGRFSSVCIETDAQLLSVVRYIHRNPIFHDERTLLGDYPWSSFSEYASGAPLTCRIDLAISLIGGIAELMRFHEKELDHERHLDVDSMGLMRDDEARSRANRVLVEYGFNVTITNVGALSAPLRDEALLLVKRTVGCSLRQLQRLSAVAYSAIRRAVHNALPIMEQLRDQGANRLRETLLRITKSHYSEGSCAVGCGIQALVGAPDQRMVLQTQPFRPGLN